MRAITLFLCSAQLTAALVYLAVESARHGDWRSYLMEFGPAAQFAMLAATACVVAGMLGKGRWTRLLALAVSLALPAWMLLRGLVL